jgi:hypothetical protein
MKHSFNILRFTGGSPQLLPKIGTLQSNSIISNNNHLSTITNNKHADNENRAHQRAVSDTKETNHDGLKSERYSHRRAISDTGPTKATMTLPNIIKRDGLLSEDSSSSRLDLSEHIYESAEHIYESFGIYICYITKVQRRPTTHVETVPQKKKDTRSLCRNCCRQT